MASARASTSSSGDQPSAVARAEAILDRVGDGLRRAREGVAAKADKAESAPAEGTPSSSEPAAPVGSPDERAEAMLTEAGDKIGRWTSAAYFQIRRAAALAREEAEDIWAEAQTLRSGSASGGEHATEGSQKSPTPANESGAD